MDETNHAVDTAQGLADDAQAMDAAEDDAPGAEISAEELARSLMEGEDARGTVEEQEDAGDDGQSAQEDRQEAGDKFSRRIASALKNQERTLLNELGGGALTKAEMKEIIRAHQAQEAARAQEQTNPGDGTQVERLSAQLRELVSDGWTREELTALCADEAVRADIEDGKTLRQAARAYERRAREAAVLHENTNTKRAVRTARSTAAGDSPQPDLIRSIPDDKYDAFMAELRRRAMRGERVRI